MCKSLNDILLERSVSKSARLFIFGTGLICLLGGFFLWPFRSPKAAIHPVTIDPIFAQVFTQVAKLTASDGAPGDNFSYSVAVSDGTAVVGANLKNGAAGQVYIFARNQGGADNWGEVKKLTGSDSTAGDHFAESVAISGDTVVVGAYTKNALTGAAYIFARNQGGANNWGEVKKLTLPDGAPYDDFGAAVAISGDIVVVSALGKNTATGAVYLFARNQGGPDNWGLFKQLTASDGVIIDQFGQAVALRGNTLVVGALGKNSYTGAAYIFERNQGGADNWGEVKKLTASDGAPNDNFGEAVAVSGDSVVIGAFSTNALAGAAYIFTRNQGGADNWGEVKKLTASDGRSSDGFGFSVAINNETAVVGALGHDNAAGKVYVFARNQGGANNWGEFQKFVAFDTIVGDLLGFPVAFSDGTLIVGARGKEAFKGTAYIFNAPLAADLTIANTASPNTVTPGTNITYTIKVNNNGPLTADAVTITDILPDSTSFVSCTATGDGTCGGMGNNRTVTFTSLSPASSETITLVATTNCGVSNGATISNTATVNSTTLDFDVTNNSSTATVTAFIPPPAITCPTSITAVTAMPGDTNLAINFSMPHTADNCSNANVTASVPPGSRFPLGTTIVKLTATDAGGATATCNFPITVWDVEIQDDKHGDVLYINSLTGDYLFVQCSTSLKLSGRGTLSFLGCTTTLTDGSRLTANFDRCPLIAGNPGSAKLTRLPSGPTFELEDGNILNHASKCR